MANKGNVKMNEVLSGKITTSMVTEYLANELGTNIFAEYLKLTGMNGNYVIMSVVLPESGIVAKGEKPSTYFEKFLDANNKSIKFEKNVIDVLEKYSYHPNTVKMITNPENYQKELQLYASIGLTQNALSKILANIKLAKVADKPYYTIYLRPEAIIEDMLKDPSTDEIEGNVVIDSVKGEDQNSIRWSVIQNKVETVFDPDDLNIKNILAQTFGQQPTGFRR